MKYYPVFLDVSGRKCCVIGGGHVAERKARLLASAGARVSVVSPVISRGLAGLVERKKVVWKSQSYRRAFLSGAFVVIAATDDRATNRTVFTDAIRAGLLVNVVDVPAESNFIVPSSIGKGDLTIAISTSGKAPCLAKKIRQDLEKEFIPRYSRLLKTVGKVRCELKASCLSSATRKAVLHRLLRQPALPKSPAGPVSGARPIKRLPRP